MPGKITIYNETLTFQLKFLSIVKWALPIACSGCLHH